ncbi:ech hydrogenase subunit A [Desulfotomaculum arcticum]|uniref:Ech hydrogenase subunit A n=1 Tax=Desulfotruncus arcticus DSM 17038 TaxID=1121424 RepID=A0A1I2YQH6_9FIRM|nr:proton-conducting transporter membrane subunit [Desulfotruncus arcticus]SFH27933.1 ech hydrogenase subunit A [Desulfotomaculum arcticum] [Desulfotruncus arcticus DSM 17038]
MANAENLVWILVILPIAAGLLGLAPLPVPVRKALLLPVSLILAVAAVWLTVTVASGGPVALVLPGQWDTVLTVLDFAVIAYFVYVGVTARHNLVTLLAVIAAVGLGVLKFAWPGTHDAAGQVFYIDMLASLMCLVICIVGSIIVLYALDYMPRHEAHLHREKSRQPQFFLYLVGFLGVMNGLVFADNLLWLYFFWELTTLCCFQLIRHDLTGEAKENALRALWMNLLGAITLVVGTGFVYQLTGSLSIQTLIGSGAVAPVALPALALLCFTGFTKAAQVPFQSWLLGAMVAPTPVSALLHSSTMVKAGVYLVLRLAPAYAGTTLSVTVALFGGLVFMLTSILAVSQPISKRILAYSTIANLGLIICCAGINTDLAMAAALALIVFHAVSKGALFMAVGMVEQQIGSRNIEDMEGLGFRSPLLATSMVVGMLSMLFLPFGVAFSKWAAIEAAGAQAGWFIIVTAFLAVGSAATLVFWAKWIGRLTTRVPAEVREDKPFLAYAGILTLVAVAVGLSILVAPLMQWLVLPAQVGMGYGRPFDLTGWNLLAQNGSFTPWVLFIALGIAVLLPALLIKGPSKEQRSPAYLCGINVDDDDAQFKSVAEAPVTVSVGGTYWKTAFGEEKLTPFCNWAALVGLAALLVGVIL